MASVLARPRRRPEKRPVIRPVKPRASQQVRLTLLAKPRLATRQLRVMVLLQARLRRSVPRRSWTWPPAARWSGRLEPSSALAVLVSSPQSPPQGRLRRVSKDV
jgi:hypothetical protein